MSIASAITAAQGKVTNAYTAVSTKGGTLPATQNLSNLSTAINSIPTGSATLITKNITQNGTYNASSDSADGYSSVTVTVSGTPKYGVMIDNLLPDIDSNGNFESLPSTPINVDLSDLVKINDDTLKFKFCKVQINNLDLSSLTTISGNVSGICEQAFAYTVAMSSIDLSSLTTISGDSTCKNMFHNCSYYGFASSRLALNIPELTTISGNYTCHLMFNGSDIISLSLPKLTTISGNYTCHSMFSSTSISSVTLPSLTTISGSHTCDGMFSSCYNLTTVTFSALQRIGDYGLYACLDYCSRLTEVNFPSLLSNFSGYTNVFDNMLAGVSGCTVHFPSNLQSEIGSWDSVTNGFSGTNTTVLFDLPSTAS